jgi:hypothetical protein
MKYRCKRCGSVFEPEDDVDLSVNAAGEELVLCPVRSDYPYAGGEAVHMKPDQLYSNRRVE